MKFFFITILVLLSFLLSPQWLRAHEGHESFMNIVKESAVTHKAVKSGLWSDPSTWGIAGLPSNGANVQIPFGLAVEYDLHSSLRIKTIRVDGKLSFSKTHDTKLLVDYIAIAEGGSFELGTATNPIPENVKVNIIFAAIDPSISAIDLNWDPFQFSRGLVAGMNASVDIHGSYKTPYAAIDGNHLAGSSSITMKNIPADWKIGDLIVLTGTEWGSSKKGDKFDDNSLNRDELLVIDSISANTITFHHKNQPTLKTLKYNHKNPTGFSFNIYVANLSRNVVFETEGRETAPIREWAHTMFMTNKTNIEYAQFIAMGRTNKNFFLNDAQIDANCKIIPGTGTNQRGRYAIHFHRIFDHDYDLNNAVHVKGVSIWGTMSWGIATHHSASLIEDSIVFDAVGAGFVTEDGSEQAIHRRNIAIKMRGSNADPVTDLLQPTDTRGKLNDFAARGNGFWIHTPYSSKEFSDNISVSSRGAAMLSWGHNDPGVAQPLISISKVPLDIQNLFSELTEIRGWRVPLRDVKNFEAYNSEQGIEFRGLTRDDSGFNSQGLGHYIPNVVDGAKIWGMRSSGMQISYASHVDILNSTFVGNPDAPIARTVETFSSPQGVGIYNDKNARHIRMINCHVEGFGIGATIPQSAGQGYNSETLIGSSLIEGGLYQNNIDNFYSAGGRQCNASSCIPMNYKNDVWAFNPYTIMKDVITEIPANNQLPVAAFTFKPHSYGVYNFDGSNSFDPDLVLTWDDLPNDEFTSGNNTIASYAWDFNNDGTDDAYGKYASYEFLADGVYPVKLTVTDIQGSKSSLVQDIAVTVNNPSHNILRNSDFSEIIVKNSGTASFADSVTTAFLGGVSVPENYKVIDWLHPTGSKFEWDSGNKWLKADSSGADITTQIIYDRHRTKYLQNISFSATHSGSANNFYLKIYGVNGRFSLDLWNGRFSKIIKDVPYSVTQIFDSGNLANKNYAWQDFDFTADFGSGYEFIVVVLGTSGVSSPEYLYVDDVKVGESSSGNHQPLPPPSVNASPIALADAFTVKSGEALYMSVLANDSDPDLDPIIITSNSNPLNGSLSLNNSVFEYISNSNFSGTDSFSYTISDGKLSSTANVSISVLANQSEPEIPNDESKNTDNILLDPSFKAVNGNEFYKNSGTFTSTSNMNKSWVVPGGHVWIKDSRNEYAFADNTGATGMIQGVSNNYQLQGLAELKFRAKHNGFNDTLRFQIIGVNSEFKLSNWETNSIKAAYYPQPINTGEVVNYKIIYDSPNFAEGQFDWTEFRIPDLDFGTGYKYIVVKVFGAGTDATVGESLLIDDISIALPPPPIVVKNLLLDSDFSSANGDFYGNTGNFVSPTHIGKLWVKPGGHKWNKDLTKQYAFADNSGAAGIIQGNLDNYQSRGLATLQFRAKHKGTGDTLRFLVLGVNDDNFSISNWQNLNSKLDYYPFTADAKPANYTVIHDSINYASTEYDWSEFRIPDLDLKSGYKYLVIKVFTGGVEPTLAEELLLDDLELLN